MGNIITSLISGFANVVGELLGAPVDFLSGKSCGSKCGSTWDLICYIENFCIGHLLKLLAVSVLFYMVSFFHPQQAVLLFFYLLFKVGICNCVCRNLCKMLGACLAYCFSSCEYGCMFIWLKLKNLKQREQRDNENDMEMCDYSCSDEDLEEGISYAHRAKASEFCRSLSRHSRERRMFHMARSLRPRCHRISIGISRRAIYRKDKSEPRKHTRHVNAVHNIKLTHMSKFVRKASRSRVYIKK